MTCEELFEYIDARPFQPFRIQMESGRTFDVRHPENIRVSEHTVYVFLFSGDESRVHEKAVMLGLSLIESIEHIDRPVSQDQN